MGIGPMPWMEYRKWWRSTPSNNSRNPDAPEHVIRSKYDMYRRKWGLPAQGMVSDQEQREREYAFHHVNGDGMDNRIDNMTRLPWRTYDGTPTLKQQLRIVEPVGDSTDMFLMSNGSILSAQSLADLGITPKLVEADGFTMSEAMNMNKKIAIVVFGTGTKEYSYLVDGETTIPENEVLLAVTHSPAGEVNDFTYLGIGKVIRIQDLIESVYDGKLKHVVTLFTVSEYNERIKRQQKKAALLSKANKLAEERNTLDKLTKLIGDSDEGRALLEQIKALDE